MRLQRLLTAGVVGLAGVTAAHVQAATPTYTLSLVTPVNGEGDWDFLKFDSINHHLLVGRAGGVDVFSVPNGVPTLVGSVPAGPGIFVTEPVPVEQFGFGFTSNGLDASTTIFDLKTLQSHTVKLPVATDGAVFDPVTGQAVFFSQTANAAFVFDFYTSKVVATIPLGDAPESGTVGLNGLVYVNLPGLNKVAVLDLEKARIETEYAVASSCSGPMGMANNPKAHLLFIGCTNGTFMEMTEKGQIVGTAPIGPVPDQLTYDPSTNTVFAGSVLATSFAIQLGSNGSVQVSPIASQIGARTITVDPSTNIAYSFTADFGPAAPGPDGHPTPFPGTLRVLTYTP